ncbi:MAG: phenylacetate--CoA ligase family protein [Bacteroidetes bacterium]|nr:phenylacetate--CoA ligase family protein [Bacteroidota bacterium]
MSLSKELKKWRKIQWYSKDELEQMQLSGLKNILNHSHKNIPYYKDIFQKVGYNENMDAPVVELKKMPFLTKKIIKENLPDQILDKTRETYFIDHTSGSSGVQGQFHYDKEAYSKTLAVQSLWWEWSGYKFGDKVIQTGMTPDRGLIKGIKDKLFRVKYTQAFQMDSHTTQKNLQPIRGTKDYYFMGYASSLYSYAKFAEELGIDDIHFKAVVSWGDKMFPHYRKLIKKQFQAEVFDTYGACEGTMIAAECEEHNYHVMTPHVIIELLNNDGNEIEPGEIGTVVVTRLDNYLMPLIRYRIGDLAIKADPEKKCACGRNFPMLEKIIGRDTDIIYTPKGRALIVHFFTGIFEHIPQIEQFQVEQKEDFPLIIRYIPDKDFNRDLLDDIKQEIYKKAGEVFPIEFTRVGEIKPTPSGKPQIVISA